MKPKMSLRVILTVMVILSFLNVLVYPASLYGDIEKCSALGKSMPYAVCYKISEKNFVTELIQEGISRGIITDPDVTTAAGAQLTSDCLYVTDGQGNERFDYYAQGIPHDRKISLPPPSHYSLFKSPNECIQREYRSIRTYFRGGVIYDSDWMSKNTFPPLYRYPIFGLGIISREEKDGLIYLDETVKMEQEGAPTPEMRVDITQIPVDPEACRVEICWGEKGLPQEIIYRGNEGGWGWVVNILETSEKDGFVYPQKATFTQKKAEEPEVINIVEIEVMDFIVGPAALEKYPVLAPEFPEYAIISDIRTAK